MMDEHDVKREWERVAAGLLSGLLLVVTGLRLWRWCCGCGMEKTVWGAIAGGPARPTSAGSRWDYGLWELCPDGQLAGVATLVLLASFVLGVILNRRIFYMVAVGMIVCGYLVNAILMFKLMAAY